MADHNRYIHANKKVIATSVSPYFQSNPILPPFEISHRGSSSSPMRQAIMANYRRFSRPDPKTMGSRIEISTAWRCVVSRVRTGRDGGRELVPKPAGRRYAVNIRQGRMELVRVRVRIQVWVDEAPAEAEVASRAACASARGVSALCLLSSSRSP